MTRTILLLVPMVLFLLSVAYGDQPNTVADDENVVLFTTSARPDAAGRSWQVPVHGWIFEREAGVRQFSPHNPHTFLATTRLRIKTRF